MNYDQCFDKLNEKSNKLSISVEKSDEKTSLHQKLLLDYVEKSDEAKMNLRDDIQSEIRLITGKTDKINEDNLNMLKLSTLFGHIRSPVKLKKEITNPFRKDLNPKNKNQCLMKEASQRKEWPTFTSENEYDHMSFNETIYMFQEEFAIKDELMTARFN
ncbi:hypothetical protein O181_041882 [Austropuccinia psidii MF-1]|uniref:Uncharacterized protein n=1 Tax=Austropuccinia psidii MF-1 TaxID=1389203 RepID=A0A9Q3HFA7_9BASI|nr:hypothetical protein [Austropuccinia psidii MF-1]